MPCTDDPAKRIRENLAKNGIAFPDSAKLIREDKQHKPKCDHTMDGSAKFSDTDSLTGTGFPPPNSPSPSVTSKHVALTLKCKDCHANPDPGESMALPTASNAWLVMRPSPQTSRQFKN